MNNVIIGTAEGTRRRVLAGLTLVTVGLLSVVGAKTPSGRTGSVGSRDITEMQYASSDGRKIPAVLSMPNGDGPFPLVVTVHGGQGNRGVAFIRTLAVPGGISPTVTMLNEQPWAILAISYRAGRGAVLGLEQDDVVAGIRFAKTLARIDPARIGVLGGSHGGHLALRAAEVMGREILCVAAGSPWMTNPRVYLFGTPDEPPLSEISARARAAVLSTRATILPGLQRNRGLSAEALDTLLSERSIEEHAAQIVVPALFLTSLADEQVPHVMVEPTIARLKAAGRDVTVYTAAKSLHGFYWGRDVGGARVGRGAKTPDELAEEAAARDHILRFFKRWFGETAQSVPASMGAPAALSRPAVAERFTQRDRNRDGRLTPKVVPAFQLFTGAAIMEAR